MKFSAILSPINCYPLTSIEKHYHKKIDKSIKIFIDNFEGVRLLKLNGRGEPIAGLHLERLKFKRKRYKILTVYTKHTERRQGHARELLEIAKDLFKDVRHNEHLTKEGESWAYAVEGMS